MPLPEPCGRSREGTGEASAGAHVGRANSAEKMMVRSAETFRSVEGKTARSARVRTVRAPRCQRTHARMYDRCRDLGGLCATTARSVAVAEVKGKSERRMQCARLTGNWLGGGSPPE